MGLALPKKGFKSNYIKKTLNPVWNVNYNIKTKGRPFELIDKNKLSSIM